MGIGLVFVSLRWNVRSLCQYVSQLARDAFLRVAWRGNLLLAPGKVFHQLPAANAISHEIQAALSETLAKLADVETQRDRWRDLARSGQARSAEMQAEIDQLKATTAALGRERDEWRALTATKAQRPPDDMNYRRKFARLRAVVVKSLHPDHGGGSQEERTIRNELFKRVWPQIERIESDL